MSGDGDRTEASGDVSDKPTLIVFKFRLPFALPLRDEDTHLFPMHAGYMDSEAEEHFGQPAVWIRLCHVSLPPEKSTPVFRPGFYEGLAALAGDDPVDVAPLEAPFEESEEVQTWVEAATPFTVLEGEDEGHTQTACFERCLKQVNHIIRGFRLVENLPHVRPINKESLDPMILFEHENPDTGERMDGHIFMLHYNLNGGFEFELLPEDKEQMVYTAMEAIAFQSPFLRHREWLERAKQARFRRGDYEEAIICLQTSVECLFAGLVSSAAVDEGLSSTEVDLRVSEQTSPFSTMVKTHLASLLGGNWSVNDQGAVANYWNQLYLVRNRLTHAGWGTAFVQIEQAFEAHDALLEFVIGRLLKKPRQFPRTLLAMLGEPGLRKRDAWTRTMREFAKGLDSEPYPYWVPWDVVGRSDPSEAMTARS